jgi:hypothetical protein
MTRLLVERRAAAQAAAEPQPFPFRVVQGYAS